MNNILIGTRAYIFDYGGTLDTGGNHWGRVLWHAWQQTGVPVGEERFREAYVYGERTLASSKIVQPDFTFRQTLAAKLRLEMEYASCMEYYDRVLDAVYQQTQQHTANSRAVLKTLSDRCPLVLVSNFYGNMATVLREFGFDGLFSHVVESAVVGVRKPDPRIFLMGVEALAMQPQDVTVVGDSVEKDIIPAHKAGCRTIWLRGEQWTDAAVDETLPDSIIDDLKALL